MRMLSVRRPVSVFLALLFLAALLSGCGQKQEPSDESSEGPAQSIAISFTSEVEGVKYVALRVSAPGEAGAFWGSGFSEPCRSPDDRILEAGETYRQYFEQDVLETSGREHLSALRLSFSAYMLDGREELSVGEYEVPLTEDLWGDELSFVLTEDHGTLKMADQADFTDMVYTNGDKFIEYLPDVNGYYLENILASEVLDAFDRAPNYQKVSNSTVIAEIFDDLTSFTEVSLAVMEEKGIDIQSAALQSYTQRYDVAATMLGVSNEQVQVIYTVAVNMFTVTYEGQQYAVFVSLKLDPVCVLGDSSYTECATGTGTPLLEILYGGTMIRIDHLIQLKTTAAISEDAAVNNSWTSFGDDGGGGYYFRSNVEWCTVEERLPLYDVVASE